MAKTLIKPGRMALLALTVALGVGQARAASNPPFIDHGNGTVTDTSTRLMWDQCAAGLGGTGAAACTTGAFTTYFWEDALMWAATQNAANYKGYADWRLPNLIELKSLVNTAFGPATIDATVFPNTRPAFFWSGLPHASLAEYAWYINFSYGDGDYSLKNHAEGVRLVRGGQFLGSFGLYATGISGVTATAVTLSAISAITATGSWLVVPRDAPPPSAAQVIAGINYVAGSTTITVAAHGTGADDAMAAKTPATFTIGGLTAGTAYDLYVVAKEFEFKTTSNVAGPLPFSTLTLSLSTSSIVIDPNTPATLYAGLDGSGVYASTDSGASWASINTADLTNHNVRTLALHNSNTLFAATYDGGVFKGISIGGTWTWASCDTGLDSARLRSLTLDAGGNLYAGSETGVFKGHIDCRDWVAMNAGLP